MVGQAARRDARGAGSAQRRRRDADGRPAQLRAHRPREHGPARHLDAECRRHSQRRLRPAADFDDLHAVKPVSRDSRSAPSNISATRRRWKSSMSRAPGGGPQTPLGTFVHIDTVSRPARRSRIRSSFRRRRSVSISRHGASLGDALDAIARIEHDNRHAVDRSSARSAATPRSSASRSPASPISFSRRSSRSMSCWASSTRASRIPSPCSRRCPRRASARCWR